MVQAAEHFEIQKNFKKMWAACFVDFLQGII